MTAPMNGLAPGRIQLWWATPDQIPAEVLEAHRARLPPEERARSERFVFENDRRIAVLTRGMVRTCLESATGVNYVEWRFGRAALGRPFIENAEFAHLTFSVSHSRSLIVCALAAGGALGVDIEPLAADAPLKIAAQHFAPAEIDDIRQLSPECRPKRFLEYWTLKEAYLKARGIGLSVPLDTVCYRISDGAIEMISTSHEVEEPSRRWQFFLEELEPRHCLAVAYMPEGGSAVDLSIDPAAPLLCSR